MSLFSHTIQTRIRYSETDKMGFCYYGNYAQFFEMGRVETLRDADVTYADLENVGVLLPVVEFQVKYFKPALYDEVINIKTTLVAEPLIKIEFDYEITNQKGELLNRAKTILVFTDANTKRPIKVPEDVLAKIRTRASRELNTAV